VVERHALGGGPDVGTGLAHALHGGERDHAASPLDAVRCAASASPTAEPAGCEVGVLLAPLTGQCADLACRDTRLRLGPLAGLGNTVGVAQYVLGPFVEAVGVSCHVFLVVGALLQPRVGDGEGNRVVGADLGREPLVAMQGGGVIEERVDEHHLDAQFLQPLTAHGGLVGRVDAAVGLGVRRPEDDHLRVLQAILEQVVLLGVAQAPAETPHVHATPVPAFPAVRVVVCVGDPHHVHEAEVRAVPVAHVAPHVVRTGRSQDGGWPCLVLDAIDLGDQHVDGLIPGDPLVSGFAAVLDVALTVGVEVHPLHGVLDPLVGVDHGLESGSESHDSRLARRGERAAARFNLPRWGVNRIVEVHRGHPDDLPVLNVDKDGSPRR
jgi:hypothetical protein